MIQMYDKVVWQMTQFAIWFDNFLPAKVSIPVYIDSCYCNKSDSKELKIKI